MSTLVVSQQPSPGGWEMPEVKPLDEAVWQAWVLKGFVEEKRTNAAMIQTAKWVSIAVLVVAAALWAEMAPFEIVTRFVVAIGAVAVMSQAFARRQYAVAVLFAAIVVLYNPLAPIFTFSGDWQRGLVAASAVPFAASLLWGRVRTGHHA